MYRPLLYLIFCLLWLSCKPPQKVSDRNASFGNNLPYQPRYKVSAQTAVFLKALRDNPAAGSPEFVPPAAWIRKYGLERIDGVYHVGGFIQEEQAADPAYLMEIKVLAGKLSGKIRPVSVPLASIPAFLQLPNIRYFEISVNTLLKTKPR